MVSWNLVNITSGIGLVPDGTQCITWSNADLPSVRSYGILLKEILQEMFKIFILIMSLTMIDLRL